MQSGTGVQDEQRADADARRDEHAERAAPIGALPADLTPAELDEVHALVREHGQTAAARLLGLSRSALGSLCAHRARRGTVTICRLSLAARHACEASR